MTIQIVAINKVELEHLEAVTEVMRTKGAPTIRAWWTGEQYYALEGSHRLAAAQALGLVPEIVEIDAEALVDWDCDVNDQEWSGAVVDDLLDHVAGGATYRF